MTTIPDPVRRHATERPGAPAVVTEAAVWTWADLDARVSACAERLCGLVPDHHVAQPGWPGEGTAVGVIARTQPDLVVLLLGALRAGVVVVPLSPRWPAAARDAAVARLGTGVLVAEPGVAAPPGVRREGLAEMTAPNHGAAAAGGLRLDARWTVVHTSGTAGEPRAALHTVGNHVASALGVNERVGLVADDCWLLDLPLNHIGGLGVVVRCALAGAAMAIPDAGTSTAAALRRFRPTHASLVSTQLFRLLRDAPPRPGGGETFPGLRAVLLGGSALAPSLLDAAVASGLPVCVGYGMTETTSTVTMTAPGDAGGGTSGTVLPGREVRVSAAGEVEVRGATLFAGYAEVRDAGASGLVRPLTADGWFRTGDAGRLDAAGRLTVAGRIGLGFVSGGENVQPEAVEAALAALAGVAEAVVVPVADAEFGARPVAFVRPSGASLPDAATLAACLRETLPGFAVPVAFHEWDGPAGMKPDRRALAAEATRRKARSG